MKVSPELSAELSRPDPDGPFWAAWMRHQATLTDMEMVWLPEIRRNAQRAEERRRFAKYDTGTISEAACVYLRALTEHYGTKIAVEIGTFIGTSALAMRADRIYTCDKSNDCGPKEKRIVCHPYTGSTRMLAGLVDQGVKADFFFFDGRIKDADEVLILALSTPATVYAFDDYEGREKGMINVERLHPYLPNHVLIEPPEDVLGLPSATTIAVLVPRGDRP